MSGVLNALAGTLKPGFADVVWTSPTVFSQTMFDADFIYPGGGGWYNFYYSFYSALAYVTLTVSQAGQPTPTISIIVSDGLGSGGLESQTVLSLLTQPNNFKSFTLRATGAGGKFEDRTFTLTAY